MLHDQGADPLREYEVFRCCAMTYFKQYTISGCEQIDIFLLHLHSRLVENRKGMSKLSIVDMRNVDVDYFVAELCAEMVDGLIARFPHGFVGQ